MSRDPNRTSWAGLAGPSLIFRSSICPVRSTPSTCAWLVWPRSDAIGSTGHGAKRFVSNRGDGSSRPSSPSGCARLRNRRRRATSTPASRGLLAFEPVEGLAKDLGRQLVPPFVLPVRHVVAERLQSGHELAARDVNRHRLILGAVRDEDRRLARRVDRLHHSRRERHDSPEYVSVADP